MKLNLVTFASSLATRESIFTDHHELLDAIREKYDVQYIFPEELDCPLPAGATMVLVGSGGVEEMVKAYIDRLPPYVVLIADGLKQRLVVLVNEDDHLCFCFRMSPFHNMQEAFLQVALGVWTIV